MLPTKRTKRMLMIVSSDIAFPGTLNLFSRPSSLIVIPSLEMPYSARLPSAVAVFIEMMKLKRMTTTKKSVAPLPDERVERADVVEALDGLRTHPAGESDRQQRVHDQREDRGRHERLPRVAHRVLVLGRERRAGVDTPSRPDHDPDPDERDLQPAPCDARCRRSCMARLDELKSPVRNGRIMKQKSGIISRAPAR